MHDTAFVDLVDPQLGRSDHTPTHVPNHLTRLRSPLEVGAGAAGGVGASPAARSIGRGRALRCGPSGRFRHGSTVWRATRWLAVVALVGVPFAMLAPDWWFLALVGSMAIAHAIDQMAGFAVRHPGATHRDLATRLVAASCVAPALLVWWLGRCTLRPVP